MTTLVAVIGDDVDEAVAVACRRAANLAREPVPDLPDELRARFDALATAWREAGRRSAVYTLVPVDPLEPLVEAWAERLSGGEDRLEMAIGLSAKRPVPDFYLVDPSLTHPHIDWYAGLLVDRAPARVRFTDMTPPAITGAVAGLSYGPALPEAADLATAAREYVPIPRLASATGRVSVGGRTDPGT